MSDQKTRSFTLRLSPEDQTALAQLCDHYGQDRPTSIRQAIRQVLTQQTALNRDGYFVPVGVVQPSAFPVHLTRKSNA